MPVDANQCVGEPSQVPPIRDPRAPRPPERLRPRMVKGVEQRELGAAARGLGQSEALGERDRIVRHPVGDQQAPPQTPDRGQWRQGRQGLPGSRRQIGHQPHHRARLPVEDEAQHGLSVPTERRRERGRVDAGILELSARDGAEQRAVPLALDEADQQRQELPPVVLFLLLHVASPAERVDARRDVGDHVLQIGVAAEAADERDLGVGGRRQQRRTGAEAETRNADGRAEPAKVAEGVADLVDLGAVQPEGDQALELRHEHELAVSSQQAGEPDQLGVSPTRTRKAVHEQQRGARRDRSVDIRLNRPTPGGQDDLLTNRIRKEQRERRFGGRKHQAQRQRRGRREAGGEDHERQRCGRQPGKVHPPPCEALHFPGRILRLESCVPRGPLFYGWWIVAAGFGIEFLIGALMFHAYGAYAVLLREEFGWSKTILSAAFAMSRAESGILGPVQGWLTDRFGPRALIRVGMTIFGVGFLLFSRIDGPVVFFLTFFMMALGSSLGGYLPVSVAIVTWFRRRRALALSISGMGMSTGGLLAPVVALSLTRFGWRWTAVASGLLVLAIGVPLAQIVRHRPEAYGLRPDGDALVDGAATAARPDVRFTARQALATRAF